VTKRWQVALAAVLSLAPLLGCGDDDGGDDGAGADTTVANGPIDGESDTPLITVDEGRVDAALLSEAEVRSVEGFSAVVATEFSDVPMFENPDPRGPCGGVVPELPVGSDATGRSFLSDRAVVIQLVMPFDSNAEAFADAYLADIDDPCADFDSLTNTGATQHVSGVDLVDLVELPEGVTGVAWTGTIAIGDQSTEVAAVALQGAEDLTFLQVLSVAPIDPEALHDLAALAAALLAD
jgi:hypothetical protein